VIHDGKTLHFAPSNGIYTYCRYNDSETVLVILNKNNEAKTIDLNHYAEAIKGRTNALNVLTGETLTLGKSLQVNGRMATVLELKK
jgi:hypothetical protein